MTSNRTTKNSSSSRTRSGGGQTKGPLLSPTMQWLALAGAAVLVVVAVFVFGIGRGSRTPTGGVGGHGLSAEIQVA